MEKRISELVREFEAWGQTVLKPSTLAVYSHYFRRWVETYGDHPIREVTPARLKQFGQTWHSMQAMQRLFKWACDEAMILEDNAIANVKRPPKGLRRRIIAPAESAKFLRACQPDLRALLIGYRETFARPQELRLATWEDLQADLPGVPIREALQLGRASIVLFDWKDSQRRSDIQAPRVIILSPRACRLLVRLYDRRECPADPIFMTGKGRAWTPNALRCRFRRLRARLGIKRDRRGETIVPYTFRHSGATTAAARGVRDRLLADVLGHVETKTTARYCHLSREHLRAAMQAVWGRHRQAG